MSEPVKPSRRERAQATRQRMLGAAHQLFCERGYAGTRMTDVAELAGVAVQTVYFTFHTKAELLQACYERAVLGPENPAPPEMQPWHVALMEARTGAEALQWFARGNGAILTRAGVLDDVVRSASHDPEAMAIRAHNEQLRRAGYRTIVDHLDSNFGLRNGVSPEAATDVMLTLGGGSVYRILVVDYGWSDAAYVAWLAQSLLETLLGPGRISG